MDVHDQVLCVLCILALCGVGWPDDLDSGTEKLSKWCSESVVFIVAWLTIPVQATEGVWNLDQWPRLGAPAQARPSSPRRIHQVAIVFEAVESLCIVPIFLN